MTKNNQRQPKNFVFTSIWLCLLLFSSHATSATDDVKPADLTNISGHFINIGKAKFKVFFFDIYQSRLASDDGKFDRDKPYLFEITYLRDITQEDLIGRTIDQWQHLGIKETQYQSYIPRLKVLWPDISKGDQLALYVEGNEAHFFYNNVFIGEVLDDSFADDFVAIWLSEQTSQPKLRKQLLGKQNND